MSITADEDYFVEILHKIHCAYDDPIRDTEIVEGVVLRETHAHENL